MLSSPCLATSLFIVFRSGESAALALQMQPLPSVLPLTLLFFVGFAAIHCMGLLFKFFPSTSPPLANSNVTLALSTIGDSVALGRLITVAVKKTQIGLCATAYPPMVRLCLLSAWKIFAMRQAKPNMAVDLAPFGRWTLRDEAAQRRSPLRWGSPSLERYRCIPASRHLDRFGQSALRLLWWSEPSAVDSVGQFLRLRFGHAGVAKVVFLAPAVCAFANVSAHAFSPKVGAGGTAPPTRRSSGASGDNAAGVPLNSTLGVMTPHIRSIVAVLALAGCISTVTAQTSTAPVSSKARAIDVTTSKRVHILGVCFLAPNHMYSLENVLDPRVAAGNYLWSFAHRKVGNTGPIKVTVLQQPAHGVLHQVTEADGNKFGEGRLDPAYPLYAYLPESGYMGKDKAVFLVEVAGVKVKVVYYLQGVAGTPGPQLDEIYCKRGYMWKISTTGRSGNYG
ncbi:MAG: hypothetical protein NTV11_19600 [Rhodocyclales bacterium]|nr:hypothetical protein [Rhodocyclales bacterium]